MKIYINNLNLNIIKDIQQVLSEQLVNSEYYIQLFIYKLKNEYWRRIKYFPSRTNLNDL